jgi:hypothetical protein
MMMRMMMRMVTVMMSMMMIMMMIWWVCLTISGEEGITTSTERIDHLGVLIDR